MTSGEGRKPEGAPERSPKAGVGTPSGFDGNGPKRFSVQRNATVTSFSRWQKRPTSPNS